MTPPAPPGSPPLERREVLGAAVHAVSLDQALTWIADRIASRAPGYVVTLNGALLVQAARDPALRRLVNEAALVTADGVGVVLAARILGISGLQRLAGIDLAVSICRQAATLGHRLFLLGASPGVPEAAARTLRQRFPALQIAGMHHGFFSAGDEPAVVAAIQAARPDVLLVALGAPRQEIWMRRWLSQVGVPVAIGVGGTLDVLAGRVVRAPRWMQVLGFEWLYRALREPRRWSVVRTIPPLFWLALRERVLGERGRRRDNRSSAVDTNTVGS